MLCDYRLNELIAALFIFSNCHNFGSLQGDDYTETKIRIAKVYNSFDIKVSV